MLASPRALRRARPVWAVCVALATACGEPASGADESTTGSDSGGPASEASEPGTGTTSEPTTGAIEEPPPTACAAVTTVTGSPRTIGEAVEFINALPRPLTLECVLERLERPLAVTGTSSVVSLQPAVGLHSPRVFLFFGEALVMSVNVDGEQGFDLLEFGETIAPARSIKGEVAFPVEAPLALSAPFGRVIERGKSNTHCAICHRHEASVPDYPLAFASNALRFPPEQEITLDTLRDEYERCDPLAQPRRCARLTALLGHGPVESVPFPDDLPTIYDQE